MEGDGANRHAKGTKAAIGRPVRFETSDVVEPADVDTSSAVDCKRLGYDEIVERIGGAAHVKAIGDNAHAVDAKGGIRGAIGINPCQLKRGVRRAIGACP